MADAQLGGATYINYTDKYRDPKFGTNSISNAQLQNIMHINSLKAALTAISATAYSAANLNKMTYNDMLYAYRLNNDMGL